ncbi:cytochrome c oxidase assembly protein [uncultured Rhodoblastus sp.]|uniref:cytochrome c oxidase assembly protein n=1 Tax=uncultured Rhodoblastus sp. TaxID=543037 RepID=UPI0025F23891|nr:cytochrome c oxidase assembly protein [uncultured Rhodoblastus sp.]
MKREPGPNNPSSAPRKTAAALGALALVMLAASFASVPLYRLFCAATGYGGATRTAESAPPTRGLRLISVRFDANVAPGLDWRFTPETAEVRVRPGETVTVFFKAENLSSHASSGLARFNVTPDQAGAWFDKISCFCFTQQKLGPHESAEWPVVFFLDPKLEQDESMASIEAITLSYTFFAPPKAADSGAAEISPGPPGKS